MIKLLLVDDQVLLRDSLKYILERDPEITVIGCAGTGKAAVEMSAALQPDVVVLDISMPEMDGIDACSVIKQANPNIRVLILTTFETDDAIVGAFLSGADGFIVKDIQPENLILSVKGVYHGLNILHRSAYGYIRSSLKKSRELLSSISTMGDEALSELDMLIIQALAGGKNNREIAELLNYSEGTIKNRISRLLNILGVKDRAQIVLSALKNNWI